MNGATLLTGALKTRKAPAQDADGVSTELPAQLLPAKAKLARVLTDYQKAGLDLSESQAHLSRSEVDEQTALNNEELGDDEIGNRIAVAQRSIQIYRARVNSRESAQAKLLKELRAGIEAAHNEYSALVQDVLTKRREILCGRLIEMGHLVGNFQSDLEMLLESSQLILDVRSLEISSGSVLCADNADTIPGLAKRILASYETIAAKAKESI
jgi:hypothetical protein